MKVIASRLCIAICVTALAGLPADACSLAFTNVAVVPMDREIVIRDQTVLIEGDRIAAIGPARTTNATGCTTVVDGGGRYLMPGLTDAHVHVESQAFAEAFGAKREPIDFEDVLALYPAYGVTTIRVMSGAPDILAFRDRSEGSSAPVLRLVVASPMLAGAPPILPPPVTRVVETADQARAAVREFVRDGYDLIKIRENLRADVFRAAVSEARRLSIDVDGHVTRGLALSDLIKAGQGGFAHLDEIARAMAADQGRGRDEIVALLKSHHVTIASTMMVLKSAAEQIADYDRLAARPQARFLHPLLTSTFWTRAQNPYLKPGAEHAFFVALLEETVRALKLLNDEGARVLAGTDALNPMIIPGLSLHEELQLMIGAGLTPYQALKAATVNPASAMRRLSNGGVLAVGRNADVMLLAADPLIDIAAAARVEGVAIRGRWLDRVALDRRLEAVAATYGRR